MRETMRVPAAWMLGLALVAGGCRGSRTGGAPEAAAPVYEADGAEVVVPVGETELDTYVYVCPDGFEFTARVAEEQAWIVFTPERIVELEQVEAASGAKYQGQRVTYWAKGLEALLETPDGRHEACRTSPVEPAWVAAAARGVDFRAIGQEPGWSLEIDEGNRAVFNWDYGQRQVVVPVPEPVVTEDGRVTTYRIRTEAHALDIEVRQERCEDIMSGEAFESAVRVVMDGEAFRGCGKALRSSE